MEIKQFVQQLWKAADHAADIERGVIYAYFTCAALDISGTAYFKQYFDDADLACCKRIYDLFLKHHMERALNIYTLVEIFEYLIPAAQRKGHGVVYTPAAIKAYIIASTLNGSEPVTVCDPACGCGSFLISAAEYMRQQHGLSFAELFEKYLYGIDIDPHAIEKTKLLFHVLAYTRGEEAGERFHLVCANALAPGVLRQLRHKAGGGFGAVIGNPPYVRAKNMDTRVKASLKHWKTAHSGNVDLYIPFYEAGVSLLSDGGRLGYISPNTFLQSVNGRALRNYLARQCFDLSILDFRETQIFRNVTSYTCIALLQKSGHAGRLRYALLNGKSALHAHTFTDYQYKAFPADAPWRMCSETIDVALRKMESAGKKLGDYKIRNGLATLKNDAYFFTPTASDEQFYYREYEGKQYRIEKAACIDIVKPNILKKESDLARRLEKAIFPYRVQDGGCTALTEEMMRHLFPHTYAFLQDIREALCMRDKGHGKYPVWFAYGRSQGLTNWGKKLLLPYIAQKPTAVLSLQEELLFYCGYAIFAEEEELRLIKCFLESSAFWYYIRHTSKPYTKGYMSLAKNYIKNFSIPALDDTQKQYLLREPDPKRRDRFICACYGLEEAAATGVQPIGCAAGQLLDGCV